MNGVGFPASSIKLSFLRITYGIFSDLVPTSVSGPNSCPPVTWVLPLCPAKKFAVPGTSLVVQWLGVRLTVWGTWIRALVREDPTCCGATKPVRHNYWACALEPESHNYWACKPQLLKPVCHNYWAREPRAHALQQEKSPQWEACAPQWRPNVAKNINKINKLKKKKSLQFLNSLGTLDFAHAVPSDWNIYPPLSACQTPSPPSRLTWNDTTSGQPSATISSIMQSSFSVLPQNHQNSLMLYSLIYWKIFTVLLWARPLSVF